MRWVVIAKVHLDHEAEEPCDFGHDGQCGRGRSDTRNQIPNRMGSILRAVVQGGRGLRGFV